MKFCHLQENGWNWRTSSIEVLNLSSEGQKPRFLSYVEHRPNTKQQYYEKKVTLRGGHIQEREGKRRTLRR
jgi:hypothetical protein